jgi:chemotaxis protein CheX
MIYFTAGQHMLQEMLQALGDHEKGAEADMVGEIANTLSGNARKAFGSEFLISVPVVLHGPNRSISFPHRVKPFVIPILWRRHRCHLMIGLEDAESQ